MQAKSPVVERWYTNSATQPVARMAMIGARNQQVITQMARPILRSASPRAKTRSDSPVPSTAAKAT